MESPHSRTLVRDRSTTRGRSALAASLTELDLAALGWPTMVRSVPVDLLADHGGPTTAPMRVVRVDRGGMLLVAAGGAPPMHARDRIRGARACVGDWVLVDAGGIAVDLVPRRSVIERRDDEDSTRPQAFAANVDVVLVVESLATGVNVGRLLRVATLARAGDADVAIVLSHADACGDVAGELAHVAGLVDHAVVATSIVDRRGVDDVRELVGAGRTGLLVGASGAGKSSLTNALLGSEVQATSHVNASGTGRHTTSAAQLVPIPGDGLLIDTPGVRGLGMHAGVEAQDAAPGDVDRYAAECRFGDCAHEAEPGCAVQAAVERGDLPADAIAAWQRLGREALRARARSDARLRSELGRERIRTTRTYVQARRRGEYGPGR